MVLSSKLKRAAGLVDDAMIAAVFAFADELFTACQRQVPVDTGNLKKSGKVHKVGEGGKKKNRSAIDGFDIIYTAPYAIDVHEGTEGNANYQHTARVKSYRRRQHGKSVWVKDHLRTHVGNHPTYSKKAGAWYSRDMSTSREGNPWIELAYIATLRKQPKWLRRMLPSVDDFIDKEAAQTGQFLRGTKKDPW